MLSLKSTLVGVIKLALLTVNLVYAAPVAKFEKRLLSPLAPVASAINGVSIILENDVDSFKAKYSFLLLSQPRGYYAGMDSCLTMGDGGYIYIPGTAGATSLVSFLNNNAVTQQEVSGYSQFWVFNGIPSNCLAVNKNTGKTDWIPCNTQLPTICYNSVMRRVLLFQDNGRQIKLDTPIGQLQGWRDQNAFRFLGIPYAEAPIGERRFAAPVARAPFTTTRDATIYGHICPQTPRSKGLVPGILSWLENSAIEDEDCLNLNVYTPRLKGSGFAPLPVMLYLHGGGFANYSGSVIMFEPGNLVSRGGTVVVTINYRLGHLGWFEDTSSWSRSTIPGNQAFRDQILALQWVRKNIASFGGDPKRVAVFGESAGATSIRALLSAPFTFDLYQSVIGESDPINVPYHTPQSAAKLTNYLMVSLGCNPGNIACARGKSTNEILEVSMKTDQLVLNDDTWTTFGIVERPTTDGGLIPADFSTLVKTGRYNTKANIMWGTTKDEAGFYVPLYFPNPIPISGATRALEVIFDKNRTAVIMSSSYFALPPSNTDAVRDAFTLFGTDYFWLCPLQYLSRQMAAHKPTYNFRFSRGRDTPLVGNNYCSSSTGRVCHSADIQPVFASGASVPGYSQTGDDARFARQVIDRLTTFAKTGNPNPQPDLIGVENRNLDVASVQWEPYGDENSVLELNVQSRMVNSLEAATCKWMDDVFLYDFWVRIPNSISNTSKSRILRLQQVDSFKFRAYSTDFTDQSDGLVVKAGKKAEVDLAVDAILKACTKKTLFCYGNGPFRIGLNLASPHEAFKATFAQKAVAAGHVVVLVDEHLTSTTCPTCLEAGNASRLAKPAMRSCVCLNCGRWLHRDAIGAQNTAAAGETWIKTFTRPLPLCRAGQSPETPYLHNSN